MIYTNSDAELVACDIFIEGKKTLVIVTLDYLEDVKAGRIQLE